MVNQKESDILNILKCLLCIGVVMIHSKIPLATIKEFCIYENFQYIFVRLIVGSLCVPFFFVLSGYFFFTNLSDGLNINYFLKKLWRRVQSILVPYLIANALIFLYFKSRRLLGFSTIDGYETIFSCFWGQQTSDLPIDQPLWYLRDILIISIFSPLIYFLLKKTGWIAILCIAVLWYMDLNVSCFYHGLFHDLGSILFFCLGALFSIKRKSILDVFSKQPIKDIVCALYLIFLVIASITRGELYAKTLSILSIPVVVCLMNLVYSKHLSDSRLIEWMGGVKKWVTATFFVFLYHYYVPAPIAKCLYHVVGYVSTELSLFVCFFFTVAEKTFYMLLLYYLVKRFFPRMASVIVGGR